MKSFYCETKILAPRDEIWKTLIATESFPDWNPYIRSCEGTLATEESVAIELHPVGGKPVTENVDVTMTPLSELAFSKEGELSAYHYVIALRPVQNQWTLVVQTGTFSGIFSPFVSTEPHQLGCERMAEALRQKVETSTEHLVTAKQ